MQMEVTRTDVAKHILQQDTEDAILLGATDNDFFKIPVLIMGYKCLTWKMEGKNYYMEKLKQDLLCY